MSVLPHRGHYTVADYMKLPDYPRQELIWGEFFVSPAPRLTHQELIGRINFDLRLWLKNHPIGRVFLSPADVILSNENVVQPDVVYVSKNRLHILTEANIQGAPDFAVEILSPSNEKNDWIRKKSLYEHFGIPEYWIIDPKHETITVMILERNKYKIAGTFKKKSIVKSAVIKGWSVDTGELFKIDY